MLLVGILKILLQPEHTLLPRTTQGMLIVWNGSTLAPLKATNWLTGLNTTSNSVAVGNLTGGNTLDIITGGGYNDGVRNYAQVIQLE